MSCVDMTSLEAGESMKITSISGDRKYINRLQSMGFREGQVLSVVLNEQKRLIIRIENGLIAMSVEENIKIKGSRV